MRIYFQLNTFHPVSNANLYPTITTSYLTWLLMFRNSNHKDTSIVNSTSFTKTSPTQLLRLLDVTYQWILFKNVSILARWVSSLLGSPWIVGLSMSSWLHMQYWIQISRWTTWSIFPLGRFGGGFASAGGVFLLLWCELGSTIVTFLTWL